MTKLTSNQLVNKSIVPGASITDALNALRVTSGDGSGDMLRSVYDDNNDGIVNRADLADSVEWVGIVNKPTTFTPDVHNHTVTEITNLQTLLDSKEDIITSGGISQYFRGDKSWSSFFDDVRAATLTGLSTVTNTVVTATDTVLAAIGKLQSQISEHKDAVSGAHSSTSISNSPAGGISATTVQGAINELDTEKADVTAVREKLTAARTYYVRTDGNDSNNGLANTSGGAFLTIQKAVDVCAALDLGIYDATIMVGAGTWPAATTLKTLVGAGKVVIRGINANTADTVIAGTAACFNGTYVGVYEIQYMTLGTNAAGTCIDIYGGGAVVRWGDVNFSAALVHVRPIAGAYAEAIGAYTISGGGDAHVSAYETAALRIVGVDVTLVGTPAFSAAFAISSRVGSLLVAGTTFSGAATGPRYKVESNGVLETAAGESFLPGSAAGITETGGRYV